VQTLDKEQLSASERRRVGAIRCSTAGLAGHMHGSMHVARGSSHWQAEPRRWLTNCCVETWH